MDDNRSTQLALPLIGMAKLKNSMAASPAKQRLPEENLAPLADDLIPEDLRDFILRHIDSIAQLEALLLLRRNPEETWTAEASAKRLYISETDATHVLDRLCADGSSGAAKISTTLQDGPTSSARWSTVSPIHIRAISFR